MKSQLITFSIIFTTIAPGILATTHFSLYIALPSFILGLVIAYLTYLLVNVKWNYEGLYGYARDFHPFNGYIFLVSWITSYYLYTIYTAIYIPYYVLNLDGLTPIIISIVVETVAVISLLTNFVYLFPIVAFSQFLLALPFGWKIGTGITPEIPSLFLNILSSSLIIVCITLSTFLGDKKEKSVYILISTFIGGGILLYSSFLIPSYLTIYANAIGNFGLILAEFYMLRNLFYAINKEKIIKYLAILAIPLVGLGNINYTIFYDYLIVPSVTLLYVSLFSSFLSVFKYFSKFYIRFLGILALMLFIYGDYNVISSSKGPLLVDGILALISSIIVSSLLYLRKKKVLFF